MDFGDAIKAMKKRKQSTKRGLEWQKPIHRTGNVY